MVYCLLWFTVYRGLPFTVVQLRSWSKIHLPVTPIYTSLMISLVSSSLSGRRAQQPLPTPVSLPSRFSFHLQPQSQSQPQSQPQSRPQSRPQAQLRPRPQPQLQSHPQFLTLFNIGQQEQQEEQEDLVLCETNDTITRCIRHHNGHHGHMLDFIATRTYFKKCLGLCRHHNHNFKIPKTISKSQSPRQNYVQRKN